MTLDTFFEKFELLADAPDAVGRMRELVLQLAVSGKLVEQDPADGHADELLKAISVVRTKACRKGPIQGAEANEVQAVDGWHSVPGTWRWTRLGNLGAIVGGGTPRSDNPDYFADDGIPWLTPADLNGFKGMRISQGRRFLTKLGLENSSAQLLPVGSVLFSSRAPIGYVAITGTELATNQGFKSCVPYIQETNEFLYYYLMSAAVRIDREASGTTFREVSGKVVCQIPVPLPPLAEQKRIVAKAEELMALCDRLEAQQQERATRHAALARASLARFAEAPTPAHLQLLFHSSYDIPPAELRKAILTLAMQGKLVAQDPGDEEGGTMVTRAATDYSPSDEHDWVGKPPTRNEVPFDLPRSWAWTRLGTVASIKHGFAFPGEGFTEDRTDFVVTTPGSFYEKGGFRDRGSKTKYFRGDVPEGFIFEAGDLIIPMTEQAPGLLGSPGFVPDDGRFHLHNQRIGKLSFKPCSILPEFAFWFFNTPFFRGELARTCTGMKVRHTSPRRILAVPIPVCSQPEQRRIVAKVEQLMALVDRLEARLTASRESAGKLLDAVAGELTNHESR